MNWRSHVFVGLVFGLVLFYLMNLPIEKIILLSVFSALSALVPDLDHKMSKGKSLLDLIVIAFAFLFAFSVEKSLEQRIIVALALIGSYFVLFTILKPKHRGITHTLLFGLGYGILIYFLFDLNYALAGFVGYFSHLLADQHIKII